MFQRPKPPQPKPDLLAKPERPDSMSATDMAEWLRRRKDIDAQNKKIAGRASYENMPRSTGGTPDPLHPKMFIGTDALSLADWCRQLKEERERQAQEEYHRQYGP